MAGQSKRAEPRVAGPQRLEAEEFEAWLTHPTTVKVNRYLQELEMNIRDQWANGEAWTDEMRRYVVDLEDFRTLEFEAIEAFYASEGE